MIFLLLIFPHSFQQGISNTAHFKDGQSKPRLARTKNLVKWQFEVQRVSQKAQYDLISKYKIATSYNKPNLQSSDTDTYYVQKDLTEIVEICSQNITATSPKTASLILW